MRHEMHACDIQGLVAEDDTDFVDVHPRMTTTTI